MEVTHGPLSRLASRNRGGGVQRFREEGAVSWAGSLVHVKLWGCGLSFPLVALLSVYPSLPTLAPSDTPLSWGDLL